MTDTFSVTITGSNNDSNLVLGSASASITESAGTHSHAVDTVPHLTTADVNGLITANETAKQAADDAATTAAADLLKVQTELLPILDNSAALVNDASGLDVKILKELSGAGGRTMVFNTWGDIIMVNSSEIIVVRPTDYKSDSFKTMVNYQNHTLLSSTDLLEFDATITGVGQTAGVFNSKYDDYPAHSVALRYYEANEISGSPAVTKIFFATARCLYCWDYDDSTKYNAFYKKPTNGKILMHRICHGIDTHFDYGSAGHSAHHLLFNAEGDLYVSSGSWHNYDYFGGENLDPSAATPLLTDERATVKMIPHQVLKAQYALDKEVPLEYDTSDNSIVTLVARGLRNACGMALDASNNVWCVNMGWDSMTFPGITTIDEKELWEDNPAGTMYKLGGENMGKSYGFPFGFVSATDLKVNGTLKTKGSLILAPSQPDLAATSDALGRNWRAYINPVSDASLADPNVFVQEAHAIFPKSSSPLALIMNQDASGGKLPYDGCSDQRYVKTKSIDNEFAVVTLKGAWNKKVGSGGAGYKVVSVDISSGEVKDFHNHPSFSSGFDEYGGLKDKNTFQSGLIAPTVYRPTGVNLDKNGSVMIASNYNYMPEPNVGPKIVTIYKP